MSSLTQIEKTLKLIREMKEAAGIKESRIDKKEEITQKTPPKKPKKENRKQKGEKINVEKKHIRPIIESKKSPPPSKTILEPGYWECPLCKEIYRSTDIDNHYRWAHPRESYRLYMLEKAMTPNAPRVKLIFGSTPGSGKRS